MLANLVAQGLQHKAGFMARNGGAVHQPACGLVDHDHIFVLPKNFQRVGVAGAIRGFGHGKAVKAHTDGAKRASVAAAGWACGRKPCCGPLAALWD